MTKKSNQTTTTHSQITERSNQTTSTKSTQTSRKFSKASGKTSPELTNALNTATTIVSKVLEVAHWIGAVGMLILAIFSFSGGTLLPTKGDISADLQHLDVYGFEATVANGTIIDYTALGWFSVGSAIILAIMAMVFRNIFLITKNSHEKTPFTEDNMRMVKELGIFFIIAPVVAVIFSGIIHLVSNIETSTNLDTVLVGLIMLYLTQIFAHGVELEEDVKDLV